MFTCHVYCYPWDLLDEGVDAALDCLVDRAGATGLTLVAACDELEQFRPHANAQPRIYRTAGGVFFQPDPACYATTRLSPPLWDQHRKLDAVAGIASHCADHRFDLRLAINPFDSTRLVAKHPQIARKNAYHIASRAAMCPSNPDVQDYLLSMIKDLSTYDDVSALVLDDVQWPAATDFRPYMEARSALDNEAAELLEYCFCESCLQASARVGIDGPAALRSAQTILDRALQQGQAQDLPWDAVLDHNPALKSFGDWVESSFLEFFTRLIRASAKPVILSFQHTDDHFVDLPAAPALLAAAPRLLMDADDMERVIGLLSRGENWSGLLKPGSLTAMELLLRIDEGLLDEAPEVVRQLSWAAEAGAGGATVTHYGALLDRQLDWLHQGLRHARRLVSA